VALRLAGRSRKDGNRVTDAVGAGEAPMPLSSALAFVAPAASSAAASAG